MLLAMTDMVLTVPLAVFSIFLGTYGVKLAPWISWEEVHYNFSRVKLVPAIVWRSDGWFMASVELTRWLYVVSAFIFFALFGFASEAQKHYKDAFQRCLRPFNQVSIFQGKWRKRSQVSLLPRFVQSPMQPDSPKELTLALSWSNDTKMGCTSQRRPESTLVGAKEFVGDQDLFDKEGSIKITQCHQATPDDAGNACSPTTVAASPLLPDGPYKYPSTGRLDWQTVSDMMRSDRRHSSYF